MSENEKDEEIVKEVQRRIPVNEVDDFGYLVKKSVEVSIREAINLAFAEKEKEFQERIQKRIDELTKEYNRLKEGKTRMEGTICEEIIIMVKELEKLKRGD